MIEINIKKVRSHGLELQAAADMFREYSIELNENIDFQDFGNELKNPLLKYGPPKGALLIALDRANPVGCIAIRAFGNGEICEMKRLYVRPAYRSHAVGRKLCEAVIQEAEELKYKSMVLDTLKRMEPAISLYKSLGFRETDPYYSNPLPDVIYMRKELY